jgi:hypothetical protein
MTSDSPIPLLGKLRPESLGQRLDRRLARAVALRARNAADRRERPHKHDAAAPARPHPRDHGLNGVERAEDVDLDDRPRRPEVGRRLVEACANAGIDEGDLDRRVRVGVIHPFGHGARIAHVEAGRGDARALAPACRRHLAETGLVTPREGQGDAGRGIFEGECAADAAAGTRQQH